MMTDRKKDEESFTEEEIARRRDEVVRRMANTPPQPRIKPPGRRPKKEAPSGADREARKKRAADKEA
jgi:hypothetical protein